MRELTAYTPKPIVNNEDDQPWRVEAQGWGEDGNNFVAAVKNYVSWGHFDFRLEAEHADYNLGYQGMPVNWQISSPRKRAFFDRLADITGTPGTPDVSVDWSPAVGHLTVRIEPTPARPLRRLVRVEVLLDNTVAASGLEQPLAFTVDRLPEGDHSVRVRVVYEGDQGEVLVESPDRRNPWWPYGGPARP